MAGRTRKRPANDWQTLAGPAEMAQLLRVTPNAICMWRMRGLLPAADLVLSGIEIWTVRTIYDWAVETGRWK
jgi:hypothetical protein